MGNKVTNKTKADFCSNWCLTQIGKALKEDWTTMNQPTNQPSISFQFEWKFYRFKNHLNLIRRKTPKFFSSFSRGLFLSVNVNIFWMFGVSIIKRIVNWDWKASIWLIKNDFCEFGKLIQNHLPFSIVPFIIYHKIYKTFQFKVRIRTKLPTNRNKIKLDNNRKWANLFKK